MSLLPQFIYLQLLDILTTLVFLMNGVKEANPLVRLALESGGPPVVVLTIVKMLAVALAYYCARSGRNRILVRANIFFAALVAWNLLVIIISSPALGLVVAQG